MMRVATAVSAGVTVLQAAEDISSRLSCARYPSPVCGRLLWSIVDGLLCCCTLQMLHRCDRDVCMLQPSNCSLCTQLLLNMCACTRAAAHTADVSMVLHPNAVCSSPWHRRCLVNITRLFIMAWLAGVQSCGTMEPCSSASFYALGLGASFHGSRQ